MPIKRNREMSVVNPIQILCEIIALTGFAVANLFMLLGSDRPDFRTRKSTICTCIAIGVLVAAIIAILVSYSFDRSQRVQEIHHHHYYATDPNSSPN